MAQFQIDIEKQLGTETWTNVYHVEAIGMTDAVGIGLDIVDLEQAIHLNTVTFTRYRVSVPGEEDPSQFVITPINEPGAGAGGGVAVDFPLFCTVRVDFGTGLGRPGRKYLRGLLVEGNVDGSRLTTGFAGAVITNYAAPLVALGVVGKQSGQLFTSATVAFPVQMRQLRRGSRRTPVLG